VSSNRRLLLGVAALVIAVDQLVKHLILAWLEPGVFVPLFGRGVGWQLIFNPGAAFGLRLPTVVFPLVALALLIIVLRSLPDDFQPLTVVAQGAVIGGAFGNIVDRVLRPGDGTRFGGFVIDFVAWGSFPRFNVADAAITVGVGLLMVAVLLEDRRDRHASRAPRDDAAAGPAPTPDTAVDHPARPEEQADHDEH
jgi:signal peptidase II